MKFISTSSLQYLDHVISIGIDHTCDYEGVGELTKEFDVTDKSGKLLRTFGSLFHATEWVRQMKYGAPTIELNNFVIDEDRYIEVATVAASIVYKNICNRYFSYATKFFIDFVNDIEIIMTTVYSDQQLLPGSPHIHPNAGKTSIMVIKDGHEIHYSTHESIDDAIKEAMNAAN